MTDKSQLEGLGACPFCRCSDEDVRTETTAAGHWKVMCRDCGASGPVRGREEWAIAAWNKRAVESAEVALAVPAQWMGIASAPKDGTNILCYRADAGVFLMAWMRPRDFMSDDEVERELGDMEGEDRDQLAEMLEEDAWYASGNRLEGAEVPTHWMPLPAAPGAAAPAEQGDARPFPEGWKSAAEKPPAPGWYERRYSDGIYAHWWSGEQWSATKDGNAHWRQLADAPYPLWRPVSAPAADQPHDVFTPPRVQ